LFMSGCCWTKIGLSKVYYLFEMLPFLLNIIAENNSPLIQIKL
jgi:hypothetical protein